MKIKKIRNIGPFIVGVLDGGELNCGRTYERVYTHYSDADGYWYSAGGGCQLRAGMDCYAIRSRH